jgi:pimeloyl-ACP methyl ester carboxylesterase
MASWKLARKRVASLVLCDTFAYHARGDEAIAQRMALLGELGLVAARPKGRGLRSTAIPLGVYIASTHATWRGDFRPVLRTLSVPACVMWGERDTITAPRWMSEEIARLVPSRPRVNIIANAGHVPNVENSEAFNAVVEHFVKHVETGRIR